MMVKYSNMACQSCGSQETDDVVESDAWMTWRCRSCGHVSAQKLES